MAQSFESKFISNVQEQRALWTAPEEYDLSSGIDRKILDRKFDDNAVLAITDRIHIIANELFTVTYPDQESDENSREQFVDDITNQGLQYGRWFYFPWKKELVHFPDIETHRKLRTARNKNLINDEEQSKLYEATIAIFGLSVGSNVVSKLVLTGIGGKLILADPDVIEPTNLNRIEGSFTDVGSSKVDFVARKISEADPYINQVHIKDKVDQETLGAVTDTHHPDIFIDEVDDLTAKIYIREEGLRSETPVLMATDTGDKAIIDVERYDQDNTLPFNGRLRGKDLDGIKLGDPKSIATALPKLIGIRNTTPRLIESFLEKGKSLSGIPQLGVTAAIGGSLVALASREIILGRKVDSGRYIFSPSEIMKFKSPTSISEAAHILHRFLKHHKS